MRIAKRNDGIEKSIISQMKCLAAEAILFNINDWYYSPVKKSFISYKDFDFYSEKVFHNTVIKIELNGVYAEVAYDGHSEAGGYRIKIIIKEDEKSSFVAGYLDKLKDRRAELYVKFCESLYEMGREYFNQEKDRLVEYGNISYSEGNKGIHSKCFTVWNSKNNEDKEFKNTKICYASEENLNSYEDWFPALFGGDEFEHVIEYKGIKCVINKRDKEDKYSDLLLTFYLVRSEDKILKLVIDNARRAEEIKFKNEMYKFVSELETGEDWFIDPEDISRAVCHKYVIRYNDLDKCIKYLSGLLPMDKFELSKGFFKKPLFDFDGTAECIVVKMKF